MEITNSLSGQSDQFSWHSCLKTFYYLRKLRTKQFQRINHFYLGQLASVFSVPIPSDVKYSN